MHIAVIAAQGRSGQAFVNEALAAGHIVRAGIRGESPFKADENLQTMQCDATNPQDVAALIASSDAVVSLLGHIPGSKADVQTQATRIIIDAMNARGLTMLISLTGTGARVPGDKPSLIDKIANAIILRIDPERIHDGVEHVKVLQESNLDYTVVRVLKLTGGPAGRFRLSQHGPAKSITSRREVAQAIMECLEDNRFVRGYPIVSPKRLLGH